MSLANIQGKLSRAEMKNIMADSGGVSGSNCSDSCSSDSEGKPALDMDVPQVIDELKN